MSDHTTYRVRALMCSEVEVYNDDADDLKEALETGDPKEIGEFFDAYDHAASQLIDNSDVVGWEITDANGVVIAKDGQEVPLTVRI